jgi:hypothetical protein
MKNITSSEKIRVFLTILAIIGMLGVGFISLSNGNPGEVKASVFQVSATPTNLKDGTPPATELAHEPDVTLGLVLAGALLMVVILYGTLHATRGQRNPPRAH